MALTILVFFLHVAEVSWGVHHVDALLD